jgi:hypothetical protein
VKEPRLGEDKPILPLGVCIYFTFIKMIILLLVLRFLIYDLYIITRSPGGDFCSTKVLNKPNSGCSVTVSGYRLKSDENQHQLNIVDILSLVFVLVAILYFCLFRKMLSNFRKYTRGEKFLENTFTVIVEGIPPFFFDAHTPMERVNYNYQKMIKDELERPIKKWLTEINEKSGTDDLSELEKEFMENVLENKEIRARDKEKIVAGVNICYELNEIEKFNHLREKMLKEDDFEDVPKRHGERLLREISSRVTILNHEYIRLSENYIFDNRNSHLPVFKLTHFTHRAFVSFQFEHYREYLISQYDHNH